MKGIDLMKQILTSPSSTRFEIHKKKKESFLTTNSLFICLKTDLVRTIYERHYPQRILLFK